MSQVQSCIITDINCQFRYIMCDEIYPPVIIHTCPVDEPHSRVTTYPLTTSHRPSPPHTSPYHLTQAPITSHQPSPPYTHRPSPPYTHWPSLSGPYESQPPHLTNVQRWLQKLITTFIPQNYPITLPSACNILSKPWHLSW